MLEFSTSWPKIIQYKARKMLALLRKAWRKLAQIESYLRSLLKEPGYVHGLCALVLASIQGVLFVSGNYVLCIILLMLSGYMFHLSRVLTHADGIIRGLACGLEKKNEL